MPSIKSSTKSQSPLLRILQEQIAPWVRAKGMDNVIVAAPSWRQFQLIDADLPDGAFATYQPLKSKRVRVRPRCSRGDYVSLVTARWPEDGLWASTAPILCFVLAGPVALPLGDYVVHCLPGHVILMPPGTPRPDGTLLCLDKTRDNNGYNSMFSMTSWANGVECWVNHTQNGEHRSHLDPREHCHVQNAQANLYLEAFTREAVARETEYRLHCGGLLSAIIAILIREIHHQRTLHSMLPSGNPINTALPFHESNLIKLAQAYIDSHLHEPLSINIVANHVYMSRAYFTRRFRQETNMSFMEYVTVSRLEKAKVLLQNSLWPTKDIAASVGLSPGRLRGIFLEREGQTPAHFRRNNRIGS